MHRQWAFPPEPKFATTAGPDHLTKPSAQPDAFHAPLSVANVGLSTEPSSGTGPADRNAVRAMALVFVPDVDAATTRAVELSEHQRGVLLPDWGGAGRTLDRALVIRLIYFVAQKDGHAGIHPMTGSSARPA